MLPWYRPYSAIKYFASVALGNGLTFGSLVLSHLKLNRTTLSTHLIAIWLVLRFSGSFSKHHVNFHPSNAGIKLTCSLFPFLDLKIFLQGNIQNFQIHCSSDRSKQSFIHMTVFVFTRRWNVSYIRFMRQEHRRDAPSMVRFLKKINLNARECVACAQTLLMLRRSKEKAFPLLLRNISKVCAQARECTRAEQIMIEMFTNSFPKVNLNVKRLSTRLFW